MGYTNSTPHYHLPQFLMTDSAKWTTDINEAFATIDNQMYENNNAAGGKELEKRVDDLETETTDLSGTVAEHDADIVLVRNRVADLEVKVSALQNGQSQDEKSIDALQNQINHILIRLDKIERRLS